MNVKISKIQSVIILQNFSFRGIFLRIPDRFLRLLYSIYKAHVYMLAIAGQTARLN